MNKRDYLFIFIYSNVLFWVALGIFIAYLKLKEYPPAYEVWHPQAHYATQMSRTTVALGRHFIVTREVDLNVTREIVQRGEASVRDLYTGKLPSYRYNFRVELEETNVHYKPGRYDANRIITIPLLPPGMYQVLTRVCWEENMIREKCVDLPELELEISE